MTTTPTSKIRIPSRLFFRIGDVADLLGVKPHVLRYWESEFSIISPQKSSTGQRIYRRSDVENLVLIRHLLHEERYSIEGAKKRIKELRKDGALKNVRSGFFVDDERLESAGAGGSDEPAVETAQVGLRAVLKQAMELKDLAARPISEIFS